MIEPSDWSPLAEVSVAGMVILFVPGLLIGFGLGLLVAGLGG